MKMNQKWIDKENNVIVTLVKEGNMFTTIENEEGLQSIILTKTFFSAFDYLNNGVIENVK
jgi:hypothetical protein